MTERARCPACGALVGFRRVAPRGLWERSLERLAGFRPYRCEVCLNRILRRGHMPAAEAGTEVASEMRAHPPFEAELDTDKFGELIEEIAAAERRRASAKPPTP